MKNRFITVILAVAMLTTALTITSCGETASYSSNVAVSDLITAADAILPESDKYTSVPDTYIQYRIGIDAAELEECTVKTNTIEEYGIFRASSEESIEIIKEALGQYFDSKLTEWEQYRPDELHKLEDASIEVMGKYVVFGILDENVKAEVFTAIENILLGK